MEGSVVTPYRYESYPEVSLETMRGLTSYKDALNVCNSSPFLRKECMKPRSPVGQILEEIRNKDTLLYLEIRELNAVNLEFGMVWEPRLPLSKIYTILALTSRDMQRIRNYRPTSSKDYLDLIPENSRTSNITSIFEDQNSISFTFTDGSFQEYDRVFWQRLMDFLLRIQQNYVDEFAGTRNLSFHITRDLLVFFDSSGLSQLDSLVYDLKKVTVS
jgi:hypothetical protein